MRRPNTLRWVGLFIVATLALTSACNTDVDSGTPAVTGQEALFEITGDVTAVNVEDIDVDVSIPSEGIDVDLDASIKVQLTVGLESVDAESAALCALKSGSQVIVVVTEKTDLEFDRPLSELNSLEDESIRATGNAHRTPGTPGGITDPSGTCELQAEKLGLVEEADGSPGPEN